MTTHSSVLAWRIPGMGEPDGLPSMGSHRVGHYWSNLAAAAAVHCIRWPKYWSFSFNISPSNEYSGLISFRIDWFDLLAVQGTLKSLFQHHNSKPLIFLHSSFFIIQLSHLYTTIKRPQLWLHRLWQKTYASSYMTLSWFVITFLPEESIF